MRKEIPMGITMVVGFTVLLANLFRVEIGGFSLAGLSQTFVGWGTIVGAIAAFLASVNIVMVHGQRVTKKREGMLNSIVLLGCMALMATLGVTGQIFTGTPYPLFTTIFSNVITPAGSAMFAMTGFYISSAAYRAFRVRSSEATVLLVAAILVMIGRAPVGELIWNQFPGIANWMMSVPNAAAQRGIMICAAIGAVASSIRILLGLDRGYLGGSD